MPSLEESFPTLVGLEPDLAGPVRGIPSRSEAFEGILRVALAGATDDRRAMAILEALDHGGLLEPAAMAAAGPTEILDTLAEGGARLTPRTALVLVRLAAWFDRRFPATGDLFDPEVPPTSTLREELSSLNGVGPSTADAILLEGLGRPAYPVDRGTYRILVRHGWIDASAEYDEVSHLLVALTGGRAKLVSRLSRGLTQVARRYCKPSSPQCQRCPLQGVLPESGPLNPEV